MKNKSKERLDILIGSNIHGARKKIGLSRQELARSVGITSVYVGLIERGQRGTELLNLFKIAENLGISFLELFMKEDGSIVETSEFGININGLLNVKNTNLDEIPEKEGITRGMFYISNMSEKQLDLTLSIMSEIYKNDL